MPETAREVHYEDCAIAWDLPQPCNCSATSDRDAEIQRLQQLNASLSEQLTDHEKHIAGLCKGVDADTSRESWSEAVARRFNDRNEQIADLTAKVALLGEKLDQAQMLCAECGRGFMDTDWALERKDLTAKVESLQSVLKSSNIPALCQCSQCRDICKEFQ